MSEARQHHSPAQLHLHIRTPSPRARASGGTLHVRVRMTDRFRAAVGSATLPTPQLSKLPPSTKIHNLKLFLPVEQSLHANAKHLASRHRDEPYEKCARGHTLQNQQRNPLVRSKRGVTHVSTRPRFTIQATSEDAALPLPISQASNGVTGRLWAALLEPIAAQTPSNPDPQLINEDFAPTLAENRIFSMWDLASLWVGLVVSVPTWFLAGSLVQLGMSWWQGVLTVFAANCVVLLPMILNGHPGTKYGLPFPVLSRASFGIWGANLPSLLRAGVACGWFGIQTWVGGQAIHQLVNTMTGGALSGPVVTWLGISWAEFGCFMAFWTMQVGIIWNGIESIRDLEAYSAPVLILMCAALLGWAYLKAGGFGEMLSTPSQFRVGGPREGQFWATFFPALTANVGFWATLSLNIPDFTRFAKSQHDQLTGQAIGLPLFMAAFTFVGLAVTSSTMVIFGRIISDPIELLGQIKGTVPIVLSLVGLILATLSTNIAANVVAPANALINLRPDAFDFRRGGMVTALVGVLLAPWRLISSTQGFIYTWLIGYSALLGPVGGIVIADYFVLRKRRIDTESLYSASPHSAYWYKGGYNPAAIIAMGAGIIPNIPGFLVSAGLKASTHPFWLRVYDNAWMVGFTLAALVYLALMGGKNNQVEGVPM